MPKQEKIDAVVELKQRIEASQIVVMSKYIGIKAGQATTLRQKLRESNVEFKVFKNTLAKRVLDELDLSAAAAYMDGPTAWAFSTDPVAPAKVLKDFGKEVPLVAMTGGILDGKVVSKDQLEALASLPPRDVLLSQVVGTIAAPLRNFVSTLNALPTNLVNVLDQIKKRKEESGAAA